MMLGKAPVSSLKVQTGLDQLVADEFKALKGLKIGILAHQASVDSRLRHIIPLVSDCSDVKIDALFGPEHGLDGAAQDMESVVEGMTPTDRRTGARLYSLYGAQEESLRPTPQMLEGLDAVVVDLQDVGARYYTYAATMGYLLEAAAGTNVRIIVLDRPNPLGGRAEDVEGPELLENYYSFVGAYPMAIRHGMTLGEYAHWVVQLKKIDVQLEVVKMKGWQREMAFEDTGLPWVMPSPNMPCMEAAWIYPGQCLLEGTNLSEGRGTTRPFELCGAPFLDGEAWAQEAAKDLGDEIILRPTSIKPMFQKHAGVSCGAVQIHVTNRSKVGSLRLSLALLKAALKLAPEQFAWRTEAYEFVKDRLAIDLLFGSDKTRLALEAGTPVDDILESFKPAEQAFRESRASILLY